MSIKVIQVGGHLGSTLRVPNAPSAPSDLSDKIAQVARSTPPGCVICQTAISTEDLPVAEYYPTRGKPVGDPVRGPFFLARRSSGLRHFVPRHAG